MIVAEIDRSFAVLIPRRISSAQGWRVERARMPHSSVPATDRRSFSEVPFRPRLIGVSARPLSIWNTLLPIEVMFHHSTAELPPRVERRLRKLIVTPRLHGIHPSVPRSEQDSNWSSSLTDWDSLRDAGRPRRTEVVSENP